MEKFLKALLAKPFVFKILKDGEGLEIGIVWVLVYLSLLLF